METNFSAAGAVLSDGTCAARYEKKFAGKALTGIENRHVYRFVKRTFDVVFSLLVFMVFCWLFAIIALLIKLDDPKGPVFFRRERVGKDGRAFYMYKSPACAWTQKRNSPN